MLESHDAACCRNPRLEDIAAEFTDAVYSIVLWHGTKGSWLDLQLGLWKALVAALREVGRETSLPPLA